MIYEFLYKTRVFVPSKLFQPIVTNTVAYYKNQEITEQKFYKIGHRSC
jgi:hypothetical protein